MSIRDEIELEYLAETGDPGLAEAVGSAVQAALDTTLMLIGIDPDVFNEQMLQIEQSAAVDWRDDL